MPPAGFTLGDRGTQSGESAQASTTKGWASIYLMPRTGGSLSLSPESLIRSPTAALGKQGSGHHSQSSPAPNSVPGKLIVINIQLWLAESTKNKWKEINKIQFWKLHFIKDTTVLNKGHEGPSEVLERRWSCVPRLEDGFCVQRIPTAREVCVAKWLCT